VNDRRVRLAAARLYLVCDAMPDEFLDACLRGGVDIIQLRAKSLDDEQLRSAGRRFGDVCAAPGALFILNDRPQLVDAVGADGVHVGQDDMSVSAARSHVGPDRIVGLSTHSPAQISAAAAAGVDYIGVGPVYATPTKPGRQPVGHALVEYAAAHAPMPFFAIGGIDASNASEVRAAGAARIAVVRALTGAGDPESAARELRGALDSSGARFGRA
jgi:thiamine-phosphate pyrophosphorylase